MAIFNIAYCEGVGKSGSSNDSISQKPQSFFGPVMYNTAGDARLVSNTANITGADEIEIPEEALAANALIRIKVVSGSGYAITGVGDTAIAAGGGIHISEGQAEPMEIGHDPDGTQHTHIRLFGV